MEVLVRMEDYKLASQVSFELIRCLVCLKEFKIISFTHLKKHELTTKSYREKFPNAALRSQEMLKVGLGGAYKNKLPEAREKAKQESLQRCKLSGFEEKRITGLKKSLKRPEYKILRRKVNSEIGKKPGVIKIRRELMIRQNKDSNFRRKIEEGQKKSKFLDEFRQGRMSCIHGKVKEAMIEAGIYEGFKSESWINYGIRVDEVNWELMIIIEVNGCHWHACSVCNKNGECFKDKRVILDKIKERRDKILSLGWRLLEIWEHELSDMPKIIEKIKSFLKLNGKWEQVQ